VSGIPILRRGLENPESYGRDLAPEIPGDKLHDPFKADVYQIGKMFHDYFKHLKEEMPELIRVFESMVVDDPICRPTAVDAYRSICDFETNMTRAQLRRLAGPKPELGPELTDTELKRMWEAHKVRKAARQAVAPERKAGDVAVSAASKANSIDATFESFVPSDAIISHITQTLHQVSDGVAPVTSIGPAPTRVLSDVINEPNTIFNEMIIITDEQEGNKTGDDTHPLINVLVADAEDPPKAGVAYYAAD